MTQSPFAAYLGLLSGAVTWGLVWYPFRLLEEAGVGGPAASAAVFAFALVLGLPFARRGLAEIRTAGLSMLGIGLSAGWTNLAYVLGVIHGEVVRVLLLFYLAPLWTVGLARWLLGERLRAAGWGVILLSIAGAATMLWSPQLGFPWPKGAGEWLGLSAGLAFSVSNVLSRRAQSLSVAAKGLAVWSGVTTVAALVTVAGGDGGELAAALTRDLPIVATLGALLAAVTVAMQYGLSRVPANQAIVILLFELVVAAVSSALLVDEPLGPREWLGGAMIVAASLLSGHMEKTR